MPEFPIVDTHLHVWDTAQLPCPWLADLPSLNQPHLPRDYDEAAIGHDVAQMVFLQCEVEPSHYREEAAWVSRLAKADPRITGIVPWAPLEKGTAVRDELAAIVEANPLTKGIRRIVQFEPDPAFCLQPDFIAGVRLLGEFDLSFDICAKGDEQLRNVIELVRNCPDTRFILDHIGKPFIEQGELEPWSTSIRDLASLPNTWCKISGLVTEANVKTWKPADLQPYIHHVLDTFGIDRVMFGGDWPVVTLASTFHRWVDTLDDAIAELSLAEKKKLYQENAIAFYRLPSIGGVT